MRKTIIISLVLAGTLILGSCSLPGDSENTNPDNSAATIQKQNPNAIIIQNFSFNPATLTIKKGATITWTNKDSVNHPIKSAVFDSGPLGKDQTFSFTFNEAGTFDYLCTAHPSMKGKIIVE